MSDFDVVVLGDASAFPIGNPTGNARSVLLQVQHKIGESSAGHEAMKPTLCPRADGSQMRPAHPVLSKFAVCHEWQTARKTGFRMPVQPNSSSL
jgi:hypothetical protein